MTIPPAIDPRMLAAEISAAVSEFNRLANLADQLGLAVEVEVLHQQTPERQCPRPILMVQVVSSL